MKSPIRITVNGRRHSLEAPVHHTLLQVLRDQLDLTGTKECCSAGECGACTVLFNSQAANSCLMLAVEADSGEITTIEGLAASGVLDPLQTAFIEKGAVQCGFCIPGMIMAARYLLMRNPRPTVPEIRDALEGDLCRCAGYGKIIEAVLAAAEESR